MKPILFNTEMVRAILDGHKTVTRRLVKDKDIINQWDCESDGTPIAYIEQLTGDRYSPTSPCPYRPGDILYVRETWNSIRFGNGVTAPFQTECWYKADDTSQNPDDKWRPSIHMPKEAARLFLRVTDVRVERLQNIDFEGCKAEGIWDDYKTYSEKYHENLARMAYLRCFSELWDSNIKKADLESTDGPLILGCG